MRFVSLALILCVLAVNTLILAQTEANTSIPTGIERPLAFGLYDGTPVRLRLTRTMSSADATLGQNVDFEVIDDVRVGETVVIPRGSSALATVTSSKPKATMGKSGKLDLNIDYVRTSLGEKINLRAIKQTKGGSHTGAMTGAIVATSLVFWPAAPFFLFMKGKDINIPKGTEITAYVSGNTELDANRYMAAYKILGTSPANATVGLVNFMIKSEPDGAEITVDGNFVGSTPSSIFLKSGEHTVKITKSGFKPYDKFVRLEPGSNITLNATLQSTW
jgi:hypothetical protein